MVTITLSPVVSWRVGMNRIGFSLSEVIYKATTSMERRHCNSQATAILINRGTLEMVDLQAQSPQKVTVKNLWFDSWMESATLTRSLKTNCYYLSDGWTLRCKSKWEEAHLTSCKPFPMFFRILLADRMFTLVVDKINSVPAIAGEVEIQAGKEFSQKSNVQF